MEKMNEEKTCPIISWRQWRSEDELPLSATCNEHECAWWDDENGRCAVVSIARQLHSVWADMPE